MCCHEKTTSFPTKSPFGAIRREDPSPWRIFIKRSSLKGPYLRGYLVRRIDSYMCWRKRKKSFPTHVHATRSNEKLRQYGWWQEHVVVVNSIGGGICWQAYLPGTSRWWKRLMGIMLRENETSTTYHCIIHHKHASSCYYIGWYAEDVVYLLMLRGVEVR